jgi:uncharacterized membrane protein YdbT with pleckstrin-like domain
MQSNEKPCPVCAELIKAAALKCRWCGEDIEAFMRRKQPAPEKTIFEGKRPIISDIGQLVLLVLAFLIWLIPGFVVLFIYWLIATTTNYKITSKKIVVSSGVFSRNVEQIDMFRVDDIGVQRPFMMRVMGYGFLTLRSSDRTGSLVKIIAKNPEQLVEKVRESCFEERDRLGVNTWARA